MSHPEQISTLRDLLAELFYKREIAEIIAKDAQLKLSHIVFYGPSWVFWDSILVLAHNSGRMERLFAEVLALEPNHAALSQAIEAYRQAVQSGDLPQTITPAWNWLPWLTALFGLIWVSVLIFTALDRRGILPSNSPLSLALTMLPGVLFASLLVLHERVSNALSGLRLPPALRNVRWFRRVATLLAGAAIAAGITWAVFGSYVSPVRIARGVSLTATDMNVAVAEFCLDVGREPIDPVVEAAVHRSVADFPLVISRTLGGLSMTVLGPDQVWLDCGASEKRIAEAASDYRLDIVVYGRLFPANGEYKVEPSFIAVDEPLVQRAGEAIERRVIGGAIPFRPGNTGLETRAAAQIAERARILNELINGLSLLSVNSHAEAVEILCSSASTLEDQVRRGSQGVEMKPMLALMHLFCGHALVDYAYTQASSQATDEYASLIAQAKMAYNKTIAFDESNARARVALADLLLAEYAVGWTNCQSPPSLLDDVAEHLAFLSTENVSLNEKTRLGMQKALGDVQLYRGQCAPTDADRFCAWKQAETIYSDLLGQDIESILDTNHAPLFRFSVHRQYGLLLYFVSFNTPDSDVNNVNLEHDIPGTCRPNEESLQRSAQQHEEAVKLLVGLMDSTSRAEAIEVGRFFLPTAIWIFCQDEQTYELARTYLDSFTSKFLDPVAEQTRILEQLGQSLRKECGL